MSHAWQVTDEDVLSVLVRHDPTVSLASPEVARAMRALSGSEARIEKAALSGTDLDDQAAAASGEIEAILLQRGVLSGVPPLSPTATGL